MAPFSSIFFPLFFLPSFLTFFLSSTSISDHWSVTRQFSKFFIYLGLADKCRCYKKLRNISGYHGSVFGMHDTKIWRELKKNETLDHNAYLIRIFWSIFLTVNALVWFFFIGWQRNIFRIKSAFICYVLIKSHMCHRYCSAVPFVWRKFWQQKQRTASDQLRLSTHFIWSISTTA